MTGNADTPAVSPLLSASAISWPYQARAREIRARISRNAGILMLAVAALVLAGRLADVPWLIRLRPHWAAMSFDSAAGFLLLGLTFVLPGGVRDRPRIRAAGRAAAVLAGLLALLGLLHYWPGFTPERVAGQPDGVSLPGRMAAATASGMLLTAVAAVLINWRTASGLRPALGAALLVGTLGLLGLVGHVYDARSLYALPFFAGMSVQSALLLSVASIGILGVHPDQGPLGVLAADGRGSRLARKLLPFGILVPVLIGWLRMQGERAGFYDFGFGLALFATASALVFIAMIWLTAMSLNREDILRRRADEVMQHDSIRRRILFEQAKDGIVVLGDDHRIVEANRSFAELIGYPHAGTEGLHPWDWIVDSRTRERIVSDWPASADDDSTFETRLRRHDGTMIDAEVSCTTARFDQEQFLFLVCRDVTQRRQSQQALYSSEQRFRRALANIPDVVAIYDTDLRIRYINNATRAVTGQAPDYFIGKRDEEVLPREICDTYLPTLRKAYLTKQIGAVETEIDVPGRGRRSLRITCVPLLGQDGQVRELLGITRDFTDRRQADSAIRDSEARYRQLIEQAVSGIIISDAAGTIELVNTRCCELLGYAEDQLHGRDRREFLVDADGARSLPDIDALLPGNEERFECRLRRFDGSAFPAEISVNVLESGHQQVMFQDITARHLQERKIARLHRIQAVLSSINSAIVRLRNREELLQETCRIAVEEGHFIIGWIGVVDHAGGGVRMVAQAGLEPAESLFDDGGAMALMPGGPGETAIARKRAVFDNDIEHSKHATAMRDLALDHGARSVISLPLVVDGQTFAVIVLYARERNYFDEEEISLLDDLAGDVAFGLEFIAKEEKLDYLAYYDAATGLPNRSLFFDSIRRQLEDAAEQGLSTVLGVVDIRRLRVINESFGRHEGDAVINEVARRFIAAVDEHDTVARIGSDTFAIAINGHFEPADVAERLETLTQKVFDAAFRIGAEDVRISATAGAAVYPEDAETPEGLLVNAEAALRIARSQGADCLLYSVDMNSRVADSLRLENKVRSALANDELTLWYQPKVCARTGELRGLEALMRWQDPESGDMVPPDVFIPVMERTGIILDAGRWALRQVASDCLRWQEQGVCPPRVAVNVSPIQLQQQDLVGTLVEAQIVANDAGTAIDLEITESVIMDDVDAMIPKLKALHSVGTRISVDDFGTGYSSLAYIARLPIDALKIDRSFVSDLHPGSEGLAIVRSIISLAKAMKLQVVAEGVETSDQVRLLRDLECDELQGYHIGRPLPPAETLAVISELSAVTEPAS